MSVRTLKDQSISASENTKNFDWLLPEGRGGRSVVGALASVHVLTNTISTTTTFDIFGLTRASDGTLKETAAVLATQISFLTTVTGHVAFVVIENDGGPIIVDGFRLKSSSGAHTGTMTFDFRVEYTEMLGM